MGANSPIEEMVRFIHEIRPDVVGFSLSILSNLHHLKREIEANRSDFRNMDLLVGGQAFRQGGLDTITQYPGTEYIQLLDDLEKMISEM